MKNTYLSAIALAGLFYLWPTIGTAESCPPAESFKFTTSWTTKGYIFTAPSGWTLEDSYYAITDALLSPITRSPLKSAPSYQWGNTELIVYLDANKTIIINQVRCSYFAIDPKLEVDGKANIIISKNVGVQTGKTEAHFLQSDWIKSPFNYLSLSCAHLEQDKCTW